MKEIKRKTIKLYQKDNGEYKMLGDSLGELKFKFGSGYRVYFAELIGKLFFYCVAVIKLLKRKI
ncbi:TPA: hypothetical protein ACU0X0_002845 [Legionella anisa]